MFFFFESLNNWISTIYIFFLTCTNTKTEQTNWEYKKISFYCFVCCFARWPLVEISDRNEWSASTFIGNSLLRRSDDINAWMFAFEVDGCWASTDANIKLKWFNCFGVHDFPLQISTNAHDTASIYHSFKTHKTNERTNERTNKKTMCCIQ